MKTNEEQLGKMFLLFSGRYQIEQCLLFCLKSVRIYLDR